MSSYRNHKAGEFYNPMTGERWELVRYSWAEDLDQRLTWLYGDAHARKFQGVFDLAAWYALGSPLDAA